MAIPFNISVTKQVIDQCQNCGVDYEDEQMIGSNCAIALALKDLFPHVFVSGDSIYPFGAHQDTVRLFLPKVAQDFIQLFDSLSGMPRVRLLLPAFDFTIEIPDDLIDMIDIAALTGRKSAELVYA